MIDHNAFGDAGFAYLGTPYSEMDCQAFVERCLADCGIKKDLPGSNAWYREINNNGWVGTPEECALQFGEVPKGAMLFILQQDGGEPEKYKKDGLGNASHIGIVTKRGEGAIHSSSSRGCVAESKFKGRTISGGWNRVGLWDQIDYGESPTPTPTPTPTYDTAVVWAANGKPVNLRKTPAGNLIERVPCGETVDIIAYGNEWTKVSWKKYVGYMMTEFLQMDIPGELYCVTIHDLLKEDAEEIVSIYGGSVTKERG